MEVQEILDLKEYYTKELYAQVRNEQKTDQTYRDDTFQVPEIKEPARLLRSGIGSRMVDAPAEQIVTSNPQAFIDVKNKDVSTRIGGLINEDWIQILKKQNPNPFKEYVKNLLGRGESFIKVVHNPSLVTGARNGEGLPVLFMIPDPMVIYASPEEDERGIPKRVIVLYERQPQDVILRYPHWTNPKGAGKGEAKDRKVEWFEYWDDDVRYIEADGVPIIGIQKNLYGFAPFIRKYSGFGRRSPDGDLSKLIVSDIRLSRDLIKEECAIRSDIASNFHLYVHPRLDVLSQGKVGTAFDNWDMGAGSINVAEDVPEGTEVKVGEVALPSAEAFQHLRDIKAEINQRNPFIMAGFPFGSSGRQQDLSSMAAMKRYDTIIENTEYAFATAFELALKICDIVPTLKPKKLNKGDLKTVYQVNIKLRASDAVEEDRKVTLGDRLWNMGNGSIDLETFHTEFQGRTKEESQRIIAKMLVDKLTIYNPDVAQVMGMVFAEESGMDKWIEEAQQKQMMAQQKGLQGQPPATTTERVQGEVQSGVGTEMIDMALSNRGARKSPSRYTRGQ